MFCSLTNQDIVALLFFFFALFRFIMNFNEELDAAAMRYVNAKIRSMGLGKPRHKANASGHNSDDEATEVANLPTPPTIPSFELTGRVINKEMSTVATSSQKQPAPIRSRRSILPSRSEDFKSLNSRFNLLKERDVRRVESSTPMIPNRQIHRIMLVEPTTFEETDPRLNVVDRQLVAQKQNRTVQVGTVLVTLHNQLSQHSDVCQAGVLIDARHGRTVNCVQGAFIGPVDNQDNHLYFHPNVRVPLTPAINDVLQIVSHTPNLDVDSCFQVMGTDAVVQVHESVRQQAQPTVKLATEQLQEAVQAVAYRNQHCLVCPTVANKFEYLSTEVELPRTRSLRWDLEERFKVVEAPRRSVWIQGQSSGSKVVEQWKDPKHPKANNDDESVNPNGSLSCQAVNVKLPQGENLVYSDEIKIDLTVTAGTQIFSKSLYEIVTSQPTMKGAARIANSLAVTNSLTFILEGSNSTFSGISLVLSCVDGTQSTSLYHQAFCGPHVVFNPFTAVETGQSVASLTIQPFALGPSWNPLTLSKLLHHVSIYALSDLSIAPKTDTYMPFKVLVDDPMQQAIIPKSPSELVDVGGVAIGAFRLPQGKTVQMAVYPFFPGDFRQATGKWFFNMLAAKCAMHSSVHMSFDLSVFVGSSFLIAGPVHVSIVACSDPATITKSNLLQWPLLTRQIKTGENVFHFDTRCLPHPITSKSCEPYSAKMSMCLAFVVWTHGSIGSREEGDYMGFVSLRNCQIHEGFGHSQWKKFTFNPPKPAANMLDVVDMRWHAMLHYHSSIKPLTTSYSRTFNLQRMANAAFNGKDNTHTKSIPPEVALMECSAFSSYVLWIRISWMKTGAVKLADCVHIVSLSTYPMGEGFGASDHVSSSEPSGQLVVAVKLDGPYKGLRYTRDTRLIGQNEKGVAVFTVDSPTTISAFSLSLAVTDALVTYPNAGSWIKDDSATTLDGFNL